MERILAIIPARGGSKGVKRKNIRKLNNKPLISYTIEAAQKSKYIDRVVVSTEDTEIAEIAKSYGAEIPCLRPMRLATDSATTTDTILHMVEYLEQNCNYFSQYVVLLQCTSPFRNERHIDEAIDKLVETQMDAITSVCEVKDNPYWSNVFKDGKLEYFIEEGRKITKRQDLPQIYTFNGAISVIKTDVLKRFKCLEPERLTGYIMDEVCSIDIDTELDFKFAEIVMNNEGIL